MAQARQHPLTNRQPAAFLGSQGHARPHRWQRDLRPAVLGFFDRYLKTSTKK
jgi:hypothetical protein